MASILPRRAKNGDVTWRVQFRIGPRMCQETFPTQDAATSFGRLVDTVGGEAARQVLQSRKGAVGVPTLNTWTTHYLNPESGVLTGISPGTREGYRRIAARSFLPVLGEYPVDAITKADVGRWVAWQEQQPTAASSTRNLSAKTIRNYHALLSQIIAAAVEHGHRTDNPAHRTRLTKGRKAESVFLTPDEFRTLAAEVPEHYRGLVWFLAGTGCRWGEATAVTWGDLNLTASPPTVRIDKAWKKGPTGAPMLGPPKSARANRTVSITRDVIHHLGTPGAKDELLFPGQFSGGHLWYGRFRTTTWLPTVARAQANGMGKTPTIHDLRHSHASWLIANGTPLPLIQARLGHESITTTVNTYGHLQPDAHMQMADTISQVMQLEQ